MLLWYKRNNTIPHNMLFLVKNRHLGDISNSCESNAWHWATSQHIFVDSFSIKSIPQNALFYFLLLYLKYRLSLFNKAFLFNKTFRSVILFFLILTFTYDHIHLLNLSPSSVSISPSLHGGEVQSSREENRILSHTQQLHAT